MSSEQFVLLASKLAQRRCIPLYVLNSSDILEATDMSVVWHGLSVKIHYVRFVVTGEDIIIVDMSNVSLLKDTEMTRSRFPIIPRNNSAGDENAIDAAKQEEDMRGQKLLGYDYLSARPF